MMRVILKHFITELCIEMAFDKISSNFNCKSVKYVNIDDFYIGQTFTTIEVLGQNRTIDNSRITQVNIMDEYITIRDIEEITFRIDKYDIVRLRFII